MTNILVTGAQGQVGSEIRQLSLKQEETNFFFANRQDLDITDIKKTESYLKEKKINTIINCAAYTAVDQAESDFLNADKVNNIAVHNIAKCCLEQDLKLIHLSTDYVFDGNTYKPYKENDAPNPISVYGKTKLSGEIAINKISPRNCCIVRTSWVYSTYGNNFLKKIIQLGKEKRKLSVVFDQIGSPTYAADLASTVLKIEKLLKNDSPETYNYTNEGVASWYDFAYQIIKSSKIDCLISPVEGDFFPTTAPRPSYSVLNKNKIREKYMIETPHWQESLHCCLNLLKKAKK